MGGLIGFLLKAILVSLSGVLAPGPVTAATLAAGTRARHAGALIALGHGLVELPLILAISAGMDRLFAHEAVKIGIGLAGGLFLLHMGVQMFRGLGKGPNSAGQYTDQNPLWIGIILTGGNPYFLLWWATVGLALAGQARELGVLAFALFAVVHWLCDFFWLEALSQAGFRGSRVLGERAQKVVLGVCSTALLFFGMMFIYDAGRNLLK